MITTIIFDFDGVITNRFTLLSVNDFCQKYKISSESFGEASRIASGGLDTNKINESDYFKKIIELLKLEVPVSEVKEFFEEVDVKNIEINKEVVDIINNLKDKFNIALASNVSEGLSNRLRNNGFYDVFDANKRFFSFELGVSKPSAVFFNFIFEKLKIDPGQAIFIDDNADNVEGAKKVGMKAIKFSKVEELKRELGLVLDSRL